MAMGGDSEYEPNDSRNVTGTASTADGRWTNDGGDPPEGVPDSNPATAQEAAKGSAKPKGGPGATRGKQAPPDQKYPAGA
jgi:hypothetical protein